MKGCLPWSSSPPPRLPLLVVVVVSLTHLSAATEQGRRASSWYDSDFTLKLPENFPANTTILRLAPVSPRPSPLRPDLLGGAGGGTGDASTLAELRVPSEKEPNSAPTAAWVWGTGVEYELLENKLDLFQIYQDPRTGVMSLSLRRAFDYTDYLSHGLYSVEAVLGPAGTPYKVECGKNGNGRRRNGGGGDGKDCGRGAGSRRDPQADRDKGIIYIKIHIVDKFRCDKPPEAACYLPEETLTLIQWENRRSSPLLGLPSPATTCPDLVPAYSITMTPPPGDNRWQAELWTSKEQLMVTPTALDRERRGETINFTVSCALKYKGKPVLAPQTKQGTLIILDEDDSPPIRSRRLSVDWHYSNKTDDDSRFH